MASGLHRPDRELVSETRAHCLADIEPEPVEVHTVEVPSREWVNFLLVRDLSGANHDA